MKLSEIYKTGINLGIKNDFRGEAGVKKHLQRHQKEFEKMSAKEKELFDTEALTNPYPDTRVNNGDLNKEVKRVLAGIDIDGAEVLLADRLGNIDLVISHHPLGQGLANLAEQMHIQAEILAKFGVPINVAQGLLLGRIGEVERRIHPVNHYQTVDTAKLLNIALMSAHTICDNSVAMFMQKLIDQKKPETVGEIMDILMEIPEYKMATKNGAGPVISTGNAKNYAGKIVVTEFTGGTEGPKLIYEKLANAGIGTVLSMHASDEHRKEAEKAHINTIVCGHMSSDSLGMNLFLDELEKRGVEVIPVSGLLRVSRNKKAVASNKPAARKTNRAKAKKRK